jgi:uncharacterized protein YndB with AHSA1/START domain
MTTIEETYTLPAPPARVFVALTDESQLKQWLAEYVRIEPRVGGQFRFWGKRTPWTPRESDADAVITQIAVPSRLSFKWTLRGCPSEADLFIEPKDPASQLRLKHSATGNLWPISESDAPWILKDFWKVTIGNLRSYLRSGKPAIEPDFSIKSGKVVLSIEIDAAPDDVFDALINPATMDKWLAKDAVASRVVGSDYSYGWKDSSGNAAGPTMLIDIVPNRLLEHDWHYTGEPITRVRWQLTELPNNRTRVTLTHTKFDDETTHSGYSQGWAAFLVGLKELSEGAK